MCSRWLRMSVETKWMDAERGTLRMIAIVRCICSWSINNVTAYTISVDGKRIVIDFIASL